MHASELMHVVPALCTCVRSPTTAIFLKNGYHLRPSFSPQFTISGESADDGGEHALLAAIPSRRAIECTQGPDVAAEHGVAGSSSASAPQASPSDDNAPRFDMDDDDEFNFIDPAASAPPAWLPPNTADSSSSQPCAATNVPAKVLHVIPTPNPAPLHLGGGSSSGKASNGRRSSTSVASAIEGLGQNLVTAMRDANDRIAQTVRDAMEEARLQRAHEKQLVEQCHAQ